MNNKKKLLSKIFTIIEIEIINAVVVFQYISCNALISGNHFYTKSIFTKINHCIYVSATFIPLFKIPNHIFHIVWSINYFLAKYTQLCFAFSAEHSLTS
jgi:hypothetical protein